MTIPAGSSSATITIDVTDDTRIEGTETVTVTLDSISSGDSDITIDSSSDDATINIADNDSAEWSITGPATVDEGDTTTNYTISLSGSFDNSETAEIVIDFTDDSTAANDLGAVTANKAELLAAIKTIADGRSDLTFNDTTGQLTFEAQSAGDTMANITFTLTATEDSLIEADEQYTVSLTTPTSTTGANVTLDSANDEVQTTIADDDSGLVSIEATTNGDEDGPVDGVFTVSQKRFRWQRDHCVDGHDDHLHDQRIVHRRRRLRHNRYQNGDNSGRKFVSHDHDRRH